MEVHKVNSANIIAHERSDELHFRDSRVSGAGSDAESVIGRSFTAYSRGAFELAHLNWSRGAKSRDKIAGWKYACFPIPDVRAWA